MTTNNSCNYAPVNHSVLTGGASGTISGVAPGSNGNVLTSNGTDWTSAAPAGTSVSHNSTLDFWDDFLYGYDLTNGGGIWISIANSGQVTTTTTSSDFANGRPGLLQFSTLASTSASPLLIANRNTSTNSFVLGGGTLTLTFYFNLDQLSTSSQRFNLNFGLSNSHTIPPSASNGLWLAYSDNVNSGDWTYNSASAGTQTNSNSSTVVATGWQVAQIVVNAAASSVSFSTGTTLSGLASLGTAITTNIPTSATLPLSMYFNITKSVGSTPVTVSLDLITLNQVLTTAR